MSLILSAALSVLKRELAFSDSYRKTTLTTSTVEIHSKIALSNGYISAAGFTVVTYDASLYVRLISKRHQ